jgi:hypothetical protein
MPGEGLFLKSATFPETVAVAGAGWPRAAATGQPPRRVPSRDARSEGGEYPAARRAQVAEPSSLGETVTLPQRVGRVAPDAPRG